MFVLCLGVELLALASFSLAEITCKPSDSNYCQAKCINGSETFTLDISNIVTYPSEIEVDSSDDVGAQSFIFSCSGKGNDCNDDQPTSVCMIETGSSNKMSCGNPSPLLATWTVHKTCPDYLFSIEYNGGACQGVSCLSSKISFAQTDQSTTSIKFTRVGDEPGAQQYMFDVTGSSVGQPSCKSGGGGGSGGGGSAVGIVGVVLILLFLIAVIAYFIVGSLFMHFTRGATGKEIIPQVEFWASLPGLVKDGCLFVISPCRRNRLYSSYDSI